MAGAAGRRGLGLALGGLALGAVLVLLSTQPAWVHVTVPRSAGGVAVALDLSGSQVAPVLVALGLLALAGVVGLVATRGWVRRAVGVLLVAAGAGVVLTTVRVVADPGAAAFGAVRGQSVDAAAAAAASYSVAGPWPWVALLGGLLVAVAGAGTVWLSRTWPAMGARYEAPGADARGDRPVDAWTALDRGEDPTVPPPSTSPQPPTPAAPRPEPEVPE
jgi:uncharacterized membrane protein (TIGR02234 family)